MSNEKLQPYDSGSCRVVRLNPTRSTAAAVAKGRAAESTALAFHSSIATAKKGHTRQSQRRRSACRTGERAKSPV